MRTSLLLLASLGVAALGCSDGGDGDGSTLDARPAPDEGVGGDAGADAAVDARGGADDCDPSHRPIVLMHGFLAAGDTWAPHAMRFAANGYCGDRVHAYDWNTLDRSADQVTPLDAFIEAVRARTGVEQIDLVGHSAGGGLGYEYLADPDRAAKVAHYVHVGSFRNDGPAGPPDAPVDTLNLWSEGDLVIEEKGDIPGATNVMLSGVDHYAVATTPESFAAIWEHVTEGGAPATTEIVPDDAPTISGRALTLGENLPEVGAEVEVWATDPATGFRAGGAPVATFIADEAGGWGPFTTTPGVYYEILVQPTEAKALHYYREPFVRSNPLVYLRTIPGPTSLVGALLGGLPQDTDEVVLVNFTASSAIIAGEDSLTLNGTQLATDDLAAPETTTIAIFAYDANRNGQSDETPVPLFQGFPFLSGVDLFFASEPPETLELELNGRVLRARNWSVRTDGVTVTVFD